MIDRIGSRTTNDWNQQWFSKCDLQNAIYKTRLWRVGHLSSLYEVKFYDIKVLEQILATAKFDNSQIIGFISLLIYTRSTTVKSTLTSKLHFAELDADYI